MRASPSVVTETPTASDNFSDVNIRNTAGEPTMLCINLKASSSGRVFADFAFSVDAEL